MDFLDNFERFVTLIDRLAVASKKFSTLFLLIVLAYLLIQILE
jgi:hypothetical protein